MRKRGGKLVCTYFEENLLKMLPPAQVEGVYGWLDYYQTVSDPFSVELLNQYNKLSRNSTTCRPRMVPRNNRKQKFHHVTRPPPITSSN